MTKARAVSGPAGFGSSVGRSGGFCLQRAEPAGEAALVVGAAGPERDGDPGDLWQGCFRTG